MYRSKGFSTCELILSALLIVIGVLTLTRPDSALESAAIIYGILAAVIGIFDIIVYVKLERRTGFGPAASLVTGILSILAGVMILLRPVVGTIALVWLFPIWFICHCISRLMNLGVTRVLAGNVYYYFSLVLNIIGLILGFALLFDPFLSAFTMAFLVGFYLILLGIDGVVNSIGNLARR